MRTFAFFISLLFAAAGLSFAAGPEAKPEYTLKPGEQWKTAEKTVQGQVVMINPARIALEYGQDKTSVREIHLDLGDEKEINFSQLKGLSSIAVEDVVAVRYLDKFVENEKGEQTQYKRTVKAISLVRSGTRSDALKSMEKRS